MKLCRPIKLITASIVIIFSINSAASEELKVAAILPLTGNAADQGEWARRGFELAREESRESTGLDIEIAYEDSIGADPKTAINAYKALKFKVNPKVIFTYGSGVGMALSPLVNADRVIQMGIATATPKYSSEGDYTFRIFPSAELETKFIANYIFTKLNHQRIAILNIENDYGVGTASALKEAYTRIGGKVVLDESYHPTESDLRSLLLKLKGTDCQAVYLASYPSDGAILLKQSRQMGFSLPFIASVAIIGGKDFFDIAGKAADNLLVASTMPSSDSEFTKRYNKKYPGDAPAQLIYAARAYDAFKTTMVASKACTLENVDCLRDALFKIKNYPGASGEFSMDNNGDISSEFQMFRVKDKGFELAN